MRAGNLFEGQSKLLGSIVAIVVCGLFPGCSGGSSGPTPTVLKVAGTYATAVTLGENSCGAGITVQSLNTVVTHTAGATTLSLQHGPVAYNGTVTTTGAFTTQPSVVQDAQNGIQSTLSVVGQFNASGLVGDVTVDVLQSSDPKSCRYKVHWVGTKQGSPNTFP